MVTWLGVCIISVPASAWRWPTAFTAVAFSSSVGHAQNMPNAIPSAMVDEDSIGDVATDEHDAPIATCTLSGNGIDENSAHVSSDQPKKLIRKGEYTLEIDQANGDGGMPIPCWQRIGLRIEDEDDFVAQAIRLLVCLGASAVVFNLWTLAQEDIMMRELSPTPAAPDGRFPSASFLVFCNRFAAVVLCSIVVKWRNGAVFRSAENDTAPLRSYVPISVLNSISSWSQYSSMLRNVDFVVLSLVVNDSKLLLVMVLAVLVNKVSYSRSQYSEAILLTVGLLVYDCLRREVNKENDDSLDIDNLGVFFLALRLISDAFSYTWKERVFLRWGRPNVSTFQMVLGINIFSATMTFVLLLIEEDLQMVFEFIGTNPISIALIARTFTLSVLGQLINIYTFRWLGPFYFICSMTMPRLVVHSIIRIVVNEVKHPASLVGVAIISAVLALMTREKYIKCRRREIIAGGVDA